MSSKAPTKQVISCILLGRTGNGKSTIGNVLVGDASSFAESAYAASETRDHSSRIIDIDDNLALRVIDTIGIGLFVFCRQTRL